MLHFFFFFAKISNAKTKINDDGVPFKTILQAFFSSVPAFVHSVRFVLFLQGPVNKHIWENRYRQTHMQWSPFRFPSPPSTQSCRVFFFKPCRYVERETTYDIMDL